ncbi:MULTISPECIES: bifunctional oligoribonuclease/PAP phosphatase NrnA [unclassified Myroides]|uniref:DHH family phosphoesterase n=1 Tax=unclassified Myroides TaxID=2642485 RepID=UPI0015FBBA0D|nr:MULTISPECIES: bifunctional oligoribonuclease/PAP phosphatase NrnA [unclassified Myroides]MBB1148935.1 bifunctional oligoribonuclease/PAP phosphatase NrnA [Myroides sp. NP-2]MDM1408122.1 bifunctional oligoribonuclease/PAP phosphatase NrnA [Myroides sp. DF42-4-2]
MKHTTLDSLKQLISSPAKRFTIIPHRNPDGDAIGSCLGLYHVLVKLGHKVEVISPNDYPNFLAWMPGTSQIKVYDFNKTAGQHILKNSDCIFTLDFNILSRTGDEMGAFLATLTNDFVMIDHHQMPGDYAKLTFSDTSFGSTCELLYSLLEQMQLTDLVDQDAATCIYTGIVTDSGSFRFPKTTAKTHQVVAALIDKGIDNPAIHHALFDNSSFNRLQLMGRALQNLRLIPDTQASYLFLSDQDLEEFKHQKGDTEGLVNYGLSIAGIDLTAFFIERQEEGIIKISFRSSGNLDVNQLARTYFEGGGHINAAGGKSTLSLEDTIKRYIEIVTNHKQDFYA